MSQVPVTKRRPSRRTSDHRRTKALVFAAVMGVLAAFLDPHTRLPASVKKFIERVFEEMDRPHSKLDSSTTVEPVRKGRT